MPSLCNIFTLKKHHYLTFQKKFIDENKELPPAKSKKYILQLFHITNHKNSVFPLNKKLWENYPSYEVWHRYQPTLD